jgi:hypothetical protein
MDSVYYDVKKDELILVRYVWSRMEPFNNHIVLEYLSPFYVLSADCTETYRAHYSIDKAKALLSSNDYTFLGFL